MSKARDPILLVILERLWAAEDGLIEELQQKEQYSESQYALLKLVRLHTNDAITLIDSIRYESQLADTQIN